MCECNREITLDADVANLPKVTALLEETLEEADCPLKTQMQLCVAAEEIFVNIANYAYAPDTGTATIRLSLGGDPAAATVTFIDRGIPFDPLAKPDPDVSLSANDRKIGGLGIFMVKKTMDEVHYEYRDGQNIFTMRKKL